jgi:hypothetical protein
MGSFTEYLGPEATAAILQRRVFQLAEEGYQHELNCEFIRNELQKPAIDEQEKVSLVNELVAAENQVDSLQRAVDWHLAKIKDLA